MEFIIQGKHGDLGLPEEVFGRPNKKKKKKKKKDLKSYPLISVANSHL